MLNTRLLHSEFSTDKIRKQLEKPLAFFQTHRWKKGIKTIWDLPEAFAVLQIESSGFAH